MHMRVEKWGKGPFIRASPFRLIGITLAVLPSVLITVCCFRVHSPLNPAPA